MNYCVSSTDCVHVVNNDIQADSIVAVVVVVAIMIAIKQVFGKAC